MNNPLLVASALPFRLPPFDAIREEHYLPAFEAGMAEHRAEIEVIATRPEPATFTNTLEALERSGRTLTRVAAAFFNIKAADSTDGLLEIERKIAPALSAHQDGIFLSAPLFARIADLAACADDLGLEAEQQRLLDRYYRDFVRAGAALPLRSQQRLRELNEELSELNAEFSRRLLAETSESAVVIRDETLLDGLTRDDIAAAREAAVDRGFDDAFLLSLDLPTQQPALSALQNRGVREQLFRAATERGMRDNDGDTRATLTRTVALRAERAQLLGFTDHASYVIDNETAGSVDAVDAMIGRVIAPAVANAQAEAKEIAEALAQDGHDQLQPWDWAYYAQRIKQERFDLDPASLRPYFELESVLHLGVFAAAGRLYGLTFNERTDLPVYHPDVRVYDVLDDGGAPLGLFLADWYARPSKSGGAWMNSFVTQSRLLGKQPVVINNLNIVRPPDGEPTLLTLTDVETMFHEFGHALHGLLSDVRYPRLAGTAVPRDFVEFPSQVNEMWAWDSELLSRYAVHHVTGEPLPTDVVARLLDSRSQGGEGFRSVEYLAATVIDLEWHRIQAPAVIAAGDVEKFEQQALERHGLRLDLVPPRYRSSYFSHIFAGGYSAAYYAYIWSEVLDADTVEWFQDNGGLRRENGETFRRELLAKGGSVDPLAAFAAVRGRAPSVEPLLKRRKLAPTVDA